jgi:predicted MFS family arabinose efflux permease
MQDELADKVSGLVTLFHSVGMLVSMNMGGYLTDTIGFRSCSDIMAMIALSALVLNTVMVIRNYGLNETIKDRN